MDINYFWIWAQARLARVRRDDHGMAAETIVIVGLSLVGATVIGGILWAKLKGAANAVTPPPTTAP